MLKKIVFALFLGFGLGSTEHAQTADQAWFPRKGWHGNSSVPYNIHTLGKGQLEQTAKKELFDGIQKLYSSSSYASPENIKGVIAMGTAKEVKKDYPDAGVPSNLEPDGFWISESHPAGRALLVIAGGNERGVLYGGFALLRKLADDHFASETPILEQPAMAVRWVDEWDNADGSIERGYAGRSIFFEGGKVRDGLAPVSEYARLLASVGINGCNVNNVNNAAPFLEPEMLKGLARIAEAMRPWGVRLALSVDIASPQKIGGLRTYDPLDAAVKAWWAAKVDEIYKLIPDFAGFTVKADSEGQPGPASYGRTPADAANLLANALQPHGGVVLYRAFVYDHHLDWNDPKADRARAAYDIFHPLDGKFAPNVIVQIKYGPIDFQVREPASPLFAGLDQTSVAMEVQITQEYLGQQRHLVYVAPMWKQVLDFDLRAGNRSTPVKDILAGKSFHRPLGGMIGVSCVGRDGWLGAPLAMANLYAFGRLAWDPNLTPEQIADEWIKQTIGTDLEVVSTVRKMLMQSWPAYERYTGPLGLQTLTDITGSHYGPNIESSENNGWGQWHRADHEGVGMDRSVAKGTGFAGQYPWEVAKIYENAATTPDDLLLFFHHVPYTYKLHDGKTVIQYLYDSHYEGAEEASELEKEWATLKGRIDPKLFDDVRARLEYQAGHAIVWRDAVVQYFLKVSGIPDEHGRAGHFPGRLEAEDARLSGYKVVDVHPWEDASRGKAIVCQGMTPQSAAGAPSNRRLVTGHDFSRAAFVHKSGWALAPAKLDPLISPNEAQNQQLTCSAEWTYTAQPGIFNLAVRYFDLLGGAAKFSLLVNGKILAAWTADASLPSQGPHGDNSTRYTARSLQLKPGDVIRVEGTPDGSDSAALDYIEIQSEGRP